MGKHVAGEPFAMVELDMLSRVDLGASMQGATVKARPVGICDAEADFVLIAVGGEALRPPCPVHLQATRTGVGDLLVSWVPRSRCGWQWVDEIESPPGESRERYRATLECNGARIEVETDVPSAMFEASALANLGAGYATLSVQQLGDLAASHAAKLDIILN